MVHAPKITIITVTLNNAGGLEKTAQSLAIQSDQAFEWVVIDGGSTDKTQNVIANLKRAPDFYTSRHDDGLYDAMNTGIAHAKGQYILFLNAGDALATEKIIAQIKLKLHEDDPDFLYGDCYEAILGGKRHYKKSRSHSRANWGLFTHHQAMVYRRDILEDMRYNLTYPIAADYDFTLRFLQHCKKISYMPMALSIFEAGGVSQTRAGQGRAEQFIIRQNLGTARPGLNVTIYLWQALAWQLRKITPEFYWFLRQYGQSGGNKDSGSAPV